MTSQPLTRGITGPTTLSQLDEAARYERFDVLQSRMVRVWESMRLNPEGESVVIVPSVSLDRAVERTGSLTQAYEERYLFLLLLLRQPRLRMTYVTSMPVAPSIIEYYLALLAGVIPSHARSRLRMMSVGDSSPQPLSEKLLARPKLLAAIAHSIPDTTLSHLIPYNTTERERDVALALGIPMYGSDPRLEDLGSKTGCRRLFAAAGIRHPLGAEDLHSAEEVVSTVVDMRRGRPTMTQVIVKLNEGVSGEGNALVDLSGTPAPGSPDERDAVLAAVKAMQLEAPDLSVQAYLDAFGRGGGIAEERILGVEVRSPSVQLRVTPHGVVELLSTHDQLLGGASGQSYLGCRFPADFGYARLIAEQARIIGERLASEGALGRFAVDFVVTRAEDGSWTPYAIELNLRKGGTTHPFLTLQFLTAGTYHADTGLFVTPMGREKHLVATDHLESPHLRGLTIDDLFDIVARHGLHFEPGRQTGVVFHMISCLTEHGRLGLTAVGDTPGEADAIYKRATQILLDEADAALRESVLPS